jgi:hypothetical protein
MPRATPLPATSQNFRVTIGSGRSSLELGFVRVDFPRLDVSARQAPTLPTAAPGDDAPMLVLRRAWDGSSALADWWNQARKSPRTKPREVVIELMDAAGQRPRLRWAFSGCRPLALQHSALDAMQPALLIESLSLVFEGVELSTP